MMQMLKTVLLWAPVVGLILTLRQGTRPEGTRLGQRLHRILIVLFLVLLIPVLFVRLPRVAMLLGIPMDSFLVFANATLAPLANQMFANRMFPLAVMGAAGCVALVAFRLFTAYKKASLVAEMRLAVLACVLGLLWAIPFGLLAMLTYAYEFAFPHGMPP